MTDVCMDCDVPLDGSAVGRPVPDMADVVEMVCPACSESKGNYRQEADSDR